MTCSNCQSENIIPDVRVIDRGYLQTYSLSVTVEADPTAMILKGTVESALRAQVCGDCGHIILFAEDPSALWKAYQDSQAGKI